MQLIKEQTLDELVKKDAIFDRKKLFCCYKEKNYYWCYAKKDQDIYYLHSVFDRNHELIWSKETEYVKY